MTRLNTVVKYLDPSHYHNALRYDNFAFQTSAVKIALDGAHHGPSRRNLFAMTVLHDTMVGARQGAWAGSAVRMIGGEGLGTALLPLARASRLLGKPSDPLIASTLERYQGRPAGLINYLGTALGLVGVAVAAVAAADVGLMAGAVAGGVGLGIAGMFTGGMLGSLGGVRGVMVRAADRIGGWKMAEMLRRYAAHPSLDMPANVGSPAGAFGGLATGAAAGIVGGALCGVMVGLAVGFAAACIATLLACGVLSYIGGAVSLIGQAICCVVGGLVGVAYGTVAGTANVIRHRVDPENQPLLGPASEAPSSPTASHDDGAFAPT